MKKKFKILDASSGEKLKLGEGQSVKGMQKLKVKQRIDKSEPYFVHIGYTFACESKKAKLYRKGRYLKLKVRPVVQARLDKLKKYWQLGVK